ncbi:DsbA family oxidoreductase [Nonomuraea gerenzanensis]|uniref:2-hydroxychromene-2-carboxylate isomerase/DsbA-like thioredoxin domain n=1 Tax=Nonomuraea gerenzanensis TaxID=93944 RepID=A0A1M4EJG5_9ACTN|nr:DsbA family oxidoreductase [Nonomuraea gerenzanensis]UBU10613.1 DsbA family oxidoreductase [Nonomuraea gerenzanensis]SBO99025.1 2-hydroxychromene-2-carboxylate isomerase/DsbA-like thioredoxin domain [Nonomuraea gerenzanensis]
MKVEIFSDVVCPWCYIGHVRFARAAERFRAKGGTIEVTMRPYQLNPDASSDGEPVIPALERKFGPDARQMVERVVGVATAEGLELNYDQAVNAATFEAHRLIEVATRQGLGKEMAERLFRAYFTEGLNVADPGVLDALAAEVGVRDSGEGAEEVREQLARARSLGISGVPLFLFEGKYAVSGAQPEDAFAAAIDEVAERTGQTPITTLAAPADGCDDGYCAV